MDHLKRPLLLEGEAGVGKTEVAKALAELHRTNLIRLQCYEGLDQAASLYEWNYQRQLLAIKAREGGDPDAVESAIFSERFLLARPLLFYFGRQFATGGDPQRIAHWESLWQYESFRHGMRLMTAMWGIGFVLEAAARVALVFVLPVSTFLFVSPLLSYAVIVGLIFWTIRYGHAAGRRGREMAETGSAPADR